MISGPASLDEIGKISIAGPATNVVFSTVFLGLTLVPSLDPWIFFAFAIGAFFNGYIAVFNLIPLGILDGFKIFHWNKAVWAFAFAVSIVLTVLSYFIVSPYI